MPAATLAPEQAQSRAQNAPVVHWHIAPLIVAQNTKSQGLSAQTLHNTESQNLSAQTLKNTESQGLSVQTLQNTKSQNLFAQALHMTRPWSPAWAAFYDAQAQFDEHTQLWPARPLKHSKLTLQPPNQQLASIKNTGADIHATRAGLNHQKLASSNSLLHYTIPPLVVTQNIKPALDVPAFKSAESNYRRVPKSALKTTSSNKGKVLVAQSSLKSLDNQFSPVAIEAFRLVQHELQKMNHAYQRLIGTHSGGHILVKKPEEKKSRQIYPVAQTKAKTNTHKKTVCPPGSTACLAGCSPSSAACLAAQHKANTTVATGFVPPKVPHTSKSVWDKKTRYPRKLKAHFVFRGGVAADGRQLKLAIYHVRDGHMVNKAHVFFKQARFDIKIDRPSGYIVGEITNSVGKVLAVGDVNLYDANVRSQIPTPGALNLVLRPYKPGLRLAAMSANTFQKKRLPKTLLHIEGLAKALKTNPKGVFVDNSFTPGSSFLMRATHKNHWPTLITGVGNYKKQNFKLFPNKMVEALLNNVLDSRQSISARKRGVVWGRVMLNGKALQNAQVQMADAPEAVPVYFSGVLPDKKQTHTTSNGFFAFVNVPQGVASLRVQHKGQLWPADIIEVQPRHVSYVQLQAHSPQHVPVKIFDAFNGAPVNSRFRVLGLDTDFSSLKGKKVISLIKAQGLMFVEVAQDKAYAPAHHSLPASAKYWHLPRVPIRWLDKIVPQDVRNVLVGFVPGPDNSLDNTPKSRPAGAGSPGTPADPSSSEGDYKVALISSPDREGASSRVLYFDAKGQKTNVGRRGGGFILLDVPLGMQTVALSSPSSKGKKAKLKVSSQMLALEQGLNVTLF